jgi:hypothetical protein
MVLSVASFAQPVHCPTAEKVELAASSSGWSSYVVERAYDKPKLVFSDMRVTENHAWCQYEVGAGTVRLRIVRTCSPLEGKWEEKGYSRVCQGPEVGLCSVECKP